MSSISLTPTSYLVLGTIATDGPATPYELKQSVAAGVGYFWSFPHSQLYSEPARLVEAGFLEEHREDDGRRRRTFSITDSGRAVLEAWLGDPTSDLPEIRDVGLLKLFFGDLARRDDLVALAESQYEAHSQRLAFYEELATVAPENATGASLGLGLAWERAASAFWRSIADSPPAGS